MAADASHPGLGATTGRAFFKISKKNQNKFHQHKVPFRSVDLVPER